MLFESGLGLIVMCVANSGETTTSSKARSIIDVIRRERKLNCINAQLKPQKVGKVWKTEIRVTKSNNRT